MLQIRCFAILILLLWLIAAPLASACRAAEDVPAWAFRAQERDRTGYAELKTASLYKGQERSVGELAEMMDKFLYGEIFSRGVLTDKQRELITAAVLTVNQNIGILGEHVGAALNAGASPEEIMEAVYQCAPYIGYTKAMEGAHAVEEALKAKGVKIPLESMASVTDGNRCAKGYAAQKSIFPSGLDGMYKSLPEGRKHIAEYLASACFGDFYTRGALDIRMRELLTLCIISAQGGCDSQVKSHVHGNLNVGNDEQTIAEAITQCLPFIGFPRTLNALAALDAVASERDG